MTSGVSPCGALSGCQPRSDCCKEVIQYHQNQFRNKLMMLIVDVGACKHQRCETTAALPPEPKPKGHQCGGSLGRCASSLVPCIGCWQGGIW